MKKIAAPLTIDNCIDDHFGHCEKFGVFSISDENAIISTEYIASAEGCGCKSNIATVLANKGVSLMLAGGIGAGAINVLSNNGITTIRGCSGNIFEAIDKYLKGEISDNGIICEHHHEEGHNCHNH